jgi:hypothetical protein
MSGSSRGKRALRAGGFVLRRWEQVCSIRHGVRSLVIQDPLGCQRFGYHQQLCARAVQVYASRNADMNRCYQRYRDNAFQTICLTYTPPNKNTSAERALVEAGSAGILDLEEALEPPNLEDALADDDAHLENAPPLDAGVGALGGVAVGAFTDDNVALLVLDLGEEFGEELDYKGSRVS